MCKMSAGGVKRQGGRSWSIPKCFIFYSLSCRVTSYELTPDRVSVFERGVRFPSHSQVNVAVAVQCSAVHNNAVLGSSVVKLCGPHRGAFPPFTWGWKQIHLWNSVLGFWIFKHWMMYKAKIWVVLNVICHDQNQTELNVTLYLWYVNVCFTLEMVGFSLSRCFFEQNMKSALIFMPLNSLLLWNCFTIITYQFCID